METASLDSAAQHCRAGVADDQRQAGPWVRVNRHCSLVASLEQAEFGPLVTCIAPLGSSSV
jgi:hypothetical protein